jgi:hypothetical protein
LLLAFRGRDKQRSRREQGPISDPFPYHQGSMWVQSCLGFERVCCVFLGKTSRSFVSPPLCTKLFASIFQELGSQHVDLLLVPGQRKFARTISLELLRSSLRYMNSCTSRAAFFRPAGRQGTPGNLLFSSLRNGTSEVRYTFHLVILVIFP